MQRPNDCWMAPSKCEDAEARQEIQVPVPLVVDQIAPLAVLVKPVEFDLGEDFGELGLMYFEWREKFSPRRSSNTCFRSKGMQWAPGLAPAVATG